MLIDSPARLTGAWSMLQAAPLKNGLLTRAEYATALPQAQAFLRLFQKLEFCLPVNDRLLFPSLVPSKKFRTAWLSEGAWLEHCLRFVAQPTAFFIRILGIFVSDENALKNSKVRRWWLRLDSPDGRLFAWLQGLLPLLSARQRPSSRGRKVPGRVHL